jgi:ribonuclease P/MRP protein subunit POP1
MLTETVDGCQAETPDDEIRTVWIRCHPSIFSSVHSTLKQAVSLTLDALKRSPKHSQNSYAVEVIDHRDSINAFEITGPKSSQVIFGALTPTIANHSGEFKKVRSIEAGRNLMILKFILVLVVLV